MRRVVLTYGLIIFFLLRESRTGKSGSLVRRAGGGRCAGGVLPHLPAQALGHRHRGRLVFGLVLLLTAMAMARVFDSPGKLFVLEAEKEKSWV